MLYGPNIPSFFILAVFLMAWLWKPRLVLQIVIPTLLKRLDVRLEDCILVNILGRILFLPSLEFTRMWP